jgi:hypothetical protein
MARFRILVLLLAVAGIASGALLGIGHWSGAVVSMIPLSALAYFSARSERYTPDVPVYQGGAIELVRKWGRRATWLGLALILLSTLVPILVFGIVIPARDGATIPNWIQTFLNMHIPYAGFTLLCAGFAVWSGAVFWRKRQGGDAKAGGT